MRFIFLDFDGVLHSNYGPASTLWYFLPRFEAVLRDYPEARVVISSSWADGRSLEELRSYFSADIRPRIVDKLQTVRHRLHGDGDRARACTRFCRRLKLRAGDWLAIDDNPRLFRHNTPLLYCFDGFREQEEALLRMVLAGEIPASRFALQAVSEMIGLEFKGDTQRARQYVLEHRPIEGDGRTLSQLLFGRKRRTVERHLYMLGCLRPPRPPLSEEQPGAGPRHAWVDGIVCLDLRREKQ